jgi:hypothetical protein
MVAKIAIPSPADHVPVKDDHRSDGDFSHLQSTLRAPEGLFHEEFVSCRAGYAGNVDSRARVIRGWHGRYCTVWNGGKRTSVRIVFVDCVALRQLRLLDCPQ